MTIACRANGIDPIDGPLADFNDTDTLVLEAQRAQILGMSGKWAIHPSQVDPIQRVFTPSPERIAVARKQKAAYQQAQQDGLGAISVDGVMVDAASIRITQSLLDRADLLGL
jgi:citrate lyase subunit beta/citryl-CoA lyase